LINNFFVNCGKARKNGQHWRAAAEKHFSTRAFGELGHFSTGALETNALQH
jgi:hypothetical protein